MKNLEEMTLKQLRGIAKDLKVKNWWNLQKAVLIEDIKAAQNEPQKQMKIYKDQCEKCGKWGVCHGYNGQLLCEDCIMELQAEAEPVEEPTEKLVPMPGIEKLAELKQPKPVKGRKMIEYNGKSQNIVAWARELGINANTLYNRIYYKGMTMDEAVNAQVKRGRPKKK